MPDTLSYFGFGSNMDPTSLAAKGVAPLRSVRATLPDWTLCFDVTHWFAHEGGVGSIRPAPGRRVEGVLHTLQPIHLDRLDAVESYGVGYDRIHVDVNTADGDVVTATTYVGLPGYTDPRCLPTRRYLNVITRGAEHAGLPDNYIAWLRAHPVHQPPPPPPFVPPTGAHPTFDLERLAATPDHTGLDGHVFDMSGCRDKHRCLIPLFGGRDTTLFHLKRLDRSDGSETLDDVIEGRLDDAQRRYLDAYLHAYADEYRYAGRLRYRP